VVGSVGRLDYRTKGTDDFLRVVALLPDHFWGLVVGSGPDKSYLESLAAELGISERVVFAGAVQDPAFAYHSMDVFCFTSHVESFGLVIAEAMACSIPVVGFDCEGGIEELLTVRTGRLLPKRDLEEMAAAVVKAVYKYDDWKQRKETAEELIKALFNWEEKSDTLSKIYKNFLNQNRY
jgi:glycosyltransferase involved in cell wall biosynthesis